MKLRALRPLASLALLFSLNHGLAEGKARQPLPTAQWVTLGTSGGPAAQAVRSQIANALVVDGSVYLFDVGNGIRRQMAIAKIPEGSVKAIFLSHHHLDHNADLGPLMVSHWTFGFGKWPVIGPVGTRHLVNGLASANDPTILAGYPSGGPAKPALSELFEAADLPADLDEAKLVFQDANVKVWTIGVDHYQTPPSIPLPAMPQAVAYRVEAGGRTFVYTGDSGPSPRLERLARNADVLISEIVDADRMAVLIPLGMQKPQPELTKAIVAGMRVNHLVPGEVGRMAAAANVKQVVLTHFVPSPEDETDPRAFLRDLQRVYRGKVTMARDLDRF